MFIKYGFDETIFLKLWKKGNIKQITTKLGVAYIPTNDAMWVFGTPFGSYYLLLEANPLIRSPNVQNNL